MTSVASVITYRVLECVWLGYSVIVLVYSSVPLLYITGWIHDETHCEGWWGSSYVKDGRLFWVWCRTQI